MAQHASATAASTTLQAIPIAKRFATVVVIMTTAPAVEFVISVAAIAAFITPAHASTAMMAVHESVKQEMPMHMI